MLEESNSYKQRYTDKEELIDTVSIFSNAHTAALCKKQLQWDRLNNSSQSEFHWKLVRFKRAHIIINSYFLTASLIWSQKY